MEIILSIAAVVAAIITYSVYLFEKWLDDNERFF